MSKNRNLADLLDSTGDVKSDALDNVSGLPDAIDVNASAPADSLNIDASGNLLVGTTGHMNYSGGTTEITVGASGTGTTAGGAITFVSNNGATQLGYIGFQESEAMIGTMSSRNLSFTTNNTVRMQLDTSGNLKYNSGYGSVATAYGVRAWVKFNGSTGNVNESGNVSSITDQGTGYYLVNFSSSLIDTGYAVSLAGRRANSNGDVAVAIRGTSDGGTTYSTSGFNFTAKTATGHNPIDLDIACVQVVR